MKKIFVLIISALFVLLISGCNKTVSTNESDLDYIRNKGNLIVGITDFAPMDYLENNEWTGFDAEVARMVAKDLGVEIEFVEIDWDNKILELNNKSVDCIWNGMTLTNEVKAAMATSKPYCNNAQVVVMKKDALDNYDSIDQLMNLQFAVEAGSAGEDAAIDKGFKYMALSSQADTLLEVDSKTSDASIIDLLMAGAMIGDNTSYSDLGYKFELTEEQYGVGCRKGSDLVTFINEEFKKFYDYGSLYKLAEKFGVQESLLAQ